MNKFVVLGYLTTVFLLVAVLFVADNVKGAKRWIEIGNFNLQPSELAKVYNNCYIGTVLNNV